MNPRDITPKVCGFPGLPKWLDLPLIKRTAERYSITEEEAREHLRLNTLCELGVKPHKADFKPLDWDEESEDTFTTAQGETRGTETVIERNEPGADACIQVNRTTLSQEPQDALEVSPEDGG